MSERLPLEGLAEWEKELLKDNPVSGECDSCGESIIFDDRGQWRTENADDAHCRQGDTHFPKYQHPCQDWHAITCPGESCAFTGFLFINLYEVDRLRGGPEEGGWWYDAGTPVDSRLVALGDGEPDFRGWTESIYEAIALMELNWPKTGDSNSVNYQGGDYLVKVQQHPGVAYPQETPRYE